MPTKDKRKRPENLIIQEIDADMTNPAFVMGTAEAQEHFLYTSLNELDQFDALKGGGSQQFRIMCLAADPGNKYGQTRVGTMVLRACYHPVQQRNIYHHPEGSALLLKRFLTDGPISRINFCTIPEGKSAKICLFTEPMMNRTVRRYGLTSIISNKVTGLIEV